MTHEECLALKVKDEEECREELVMLDLWVAASMTRGKGRSDRVGCSSISVVVGLGLNCSCDT